MKPKLEQIAGIPAPTPDDAGKALTPKGDGTFEWKTGLAGEPASLTVPGVVQLASPQEALSGASASKVVTPAALALARSQDALARDQAILAALDGAIAPGGEGVSAGYVSTQLSAEATARSNAIALAQEAERVQREQAIAALKAEIQALLAQLGQGGSTPGGGTTTPTNPGGNTGGGTIPANTMFDRFGSPYIDRFGEYIQTRVPIVINPPADSTGTPPVEQVLPDNVLRDRFGSPFIMRDGTYLMVRTAPDVVQPVEETPTTTPPVVTPVPVQVYPTTPHLRVESNHGNVIVESQDGVNAVIRLVRPLYKDTQILNVTHHNTPLSNSNTFWTYKGVDNLFTDINGQPGVRRNVLSTDDGSFTTDTLQSMSDGSFLELHLTIKISPERTGAPPAPTPVPDVRSVIFEENFAPGTGSGILIGAGGNIQNTGKGSLLLLGKSWAMQEAHPDKRNTADYGFGNGQYDMWVRFIGDKGDEGGPCAELWLADNVWPGYEIDIGEISPDGRVYFAKHWEDKNFPQEGNQQNRSITYIVPDSYNRFEINKNTAILSNDGVIFKVNDVEFVRSMGPNAPKDFWNGGVNHIFGLLAGSEHSSDGSPSGIECFRMRFTPEALLTAEPTATPGVAITSVTTSQTSPVVMGVPVAHRIQTTGVTKVGYVRLGSDAMGNVWRNEPVFVDTTGDVTVSLPFWENGERLLVILEKTHPKSLWVKGPIFQVSRPTVSPAANPTTSTDPINVLVRGQSNARRFIESGGGAKLKTLLQNSTGRSINVLSSFGLDASTIHPDSAFMDWDTDGKQTSLLRFVNGLSTTEKSRKTITLWLQNEDEQRNKALTGSAYAAKIRADATLVRNALGQSASRTPYLFASIRYNYGNNFDAVNAGWLSLRNDAAFKAFITYDTAADDVVMDGDGYPRSSHIGNADALLLADKLAPSLKNIINSI